ncbi:cyclin-D3-1 [Euphorbia lathyris]|uniref:cyclin-D3-1 n=1 Tax=Euphorbia lathyris TaxID=212925 RepID=UPI0033142698
MAIHQPQQSSNSLLLDTLYCEEEENWEENEVTQVEKFSSFFPPNSLLEQDLFWEDGELLSLFTKEHNVGTKLLDSSSISRQEAIDWILKVNSYYGFSNLTSILAINYLDRFLICPKKDNDDNKPWMIQLLAVTCLSLAAKIEETQVPLLLHLQVEDTKYVFEAKTIQRMELLVLSTLQWKMHPVTPLSFVDHIIRRLGLKTSLHWEFLRRCESLLITLVSDSRSTCFLPSVLATATMMHVIDQVEPFNSIDYQNQLLGILKINKEKVKDCYELICELLKRRSNGGYYGHKKRKYEAIPSSPSGVIDAIFSSDNSNDSWPISTSSSVSSSPQQQQPLFKKNRGAHDQCVFVEQ